MSASQIVRTAPINPNNLNNPSNVALDVKPSRILTGVGAPSATTGTLFDYYIATDTGNFYSKSSAGVWSLIYNFTVTPGTGLTDLANLGSGAQIYSPPAIAGIASLRTLVSNTNKINFLTEANDISLGVNLDKTDVGLSLVQNVLNNYTAVSNPLAINDSTQGYSVGSFWWNSSNGNLYFCMSAAIGAAVWTLINVAASGFLTGCANLGFGFGGIFANVTGSTANFKSLTSIDASILVTSNATTVNLQALPPPGLFKDIFSAGFVDTVSTTIGSPGTQYQVSQPWQFNAGFSRGSWSIIGSSPNLSIQRTSTTSGSPPYTYNIQLYLSYTTTGNFVGQSRVSFLLISNTGNCTFAPNFNNVTTSGYGPAGARLVDTTMTTLMRFSDNNPGSFYLAVYADAVQSLVNVSTQITIIQI